MGVAATAAAAVSSGVSLTGQTHNATVPKYGNFIPPICSSESEHKMGYLELQIQGIPPDALQAKKTSLENMFRDVYNEITGTLFLFSMSSVHSVFLLFFFKSIFS